MKIVLKILLLFVLISFCVSVLVNSLNMKIVFPAFVDVQNTIRFISDLITILGLITLIIALVEYYKRKNEEKNKIAEEKMRVIKTAKYQLATIGRWTGFEGGGYREKDLEAWKQREFITRANPFHAIYKINDSFLRNLSSLPGTHIFNNKVNEAIAWLLQWITSFNSYLQEIIEFKFSRDTQKNIILGKKLNSGDISKLDQEELDFANKLVNMYATLHFEIISDENNQRLHYWHKKIINLLNDEEKDIQKSRKKYLT